MFTESTGFLSANSAPGTEHEPSVLFSRMQAMLYVQGSSGREYHGDGAMEVAPEPYAAAYEIDWSLCEQSVETVTSKSSLLPSVLLRWSQS
jgi:hypothetical protein